MAIVDHFEVWWPLLVNWLGKRTGDPENVAAEAFLKSWRAEQRGVAVERGYVFMVAKRLLIDIARRKQPDCVHVDLSGVGAPDRDLALPMIAAEALDQCLPRGRVALVMKAEGYQDDEIAVAIGTPLDGTKQVIRRARNRIKKWEAA